MKTQHTPGPWRFEQATKTIRSIPENYWLATMDSWDGAVNHESNARLIAAAPELFEALERLLAWADMQRDSMAYESARREIGQARVAIAKATGKQ